MLFYEDLLAIQPKPAPPQVDLEALGRQQAEQDKLTVQEAEQRLLQTYANVPVPPLNEIPHVVQGNLQSHYNVLVHADGVVRELEAMRGLAMTDSESQAIAGPSKISVPISVLSIKECEALVRICVSEMASCHWETGSFHCIDESSRWARCITSTRNHEGMPPTLPHDFIPHIILEAFRNAYTRKFSNRYPRNSCEYRERPGHRIPHR